MGKLKDHSGRKFNMLTASNIAYRDDVNRAYYSCVCDCGNTTIVSGSKLASGQVKSCGCLAYKTKHGHSKKNEMTKEYKAWASMKQRCDNHTSKSYKDYGGRGISYSSDFESFEGFIKFVGYAPSKNHQIDRINVNGDYSPDNVRWILQKNNAKNKRTYKNSSTGFKGVTKSGNNYRVRIFCDGKCEYYKSFDNLKDAVFAYNENALRIHGDFAHLNDVGSL